MYKINERRLINYVSFLHKIFVLIFYKFLIFIYCCYLKQHTFKEKLIYFEIKYECVNF